MSQLTIRPLEQGDFARWLPLWEGYNVFYERVVPADVTRMTWSRFFDAYEPLFAHVAEENGELVGLVHYLYHRHTAMIGPACYLQDLFTSEDLRGKGVGRRLIMSVYEAAKKAGSTRVYWQTHETNTVAQKLYDQVAEKSGFIIYRETI